MSYCAALAAAGGEILAHKYFGSYQGEWWAKVRYAGQTYWVNGAYGSCSGCDHFWAAFCYNDSTRCPKHRYENDPPLNCPDCVDANSAYQTKLAEFGRKYLFGNEFTQAEAERHAGANDWDEESENMLQFLRDNAI